MNYIQQEIHNKVAWFISICHVLIRIVIKYLAILGYFICNRQIDIFGIRKAVKNSKQHKS